MSHSIKCTCPKCGEVYSASADHAGKGIPCRCGAIVRIPVPVKEVYVPPTQQNTTPPPRPETSYRERPTYTKPAEPKTDWGRLLKESKGFIMAVATALLLVVLTALSQEPLFGVAAIGCFTGWLFVRKNEAPWARGLASVLTSTALGFTLLLVILAALNTMYTGSADQLPGWLVMLDDFLIWSKDNLDIVAEMSLGIYILIIFILLPVAALKPHWKPITRFTDNKSLLGKAAAVLMVITSFTFFSPQAMEHAVDKNYYKHYRAIVRQDLKEHRRALIAEAIKQKVTAENQTVLPENLDAFTEQVAQVFNTALRVTDTNSITLRANVQYDVDIVVERSHVELSKNPDYNTEWESADKKIAEKWRAERQKPDWPSHRRVVVQEAATTARQTATFANEAVAGVKGIFGEMAQGLMPEEVTGFMKMYLEETISVLSEYVWNGTEAADIVNQLFEPFAPTGKVYKTGGFSELGYAWQLGKLDITTLPPDMPVPEEPIASEDVQGTYDGSSEVSSGGGKGTRPQINQHYNVDEPTMKEIWKCGRCGRTVSRHARVCGCGVIFIN